MNRSLALFEKKGVLNDDGVVSVWYQSLGNNTADDHPFYANLPLELMYSSLAAMWAIGYKVSKFT